MLLLIKNIYILRYIPQKGDRIIGIVCPNVSGDNFKIDIGCADNAFVNFLSFEGFFLLQE